MVYFAKIVIVLSAACLFDLVAAHPGEHHDHHAIKHQIQVRDRMASSAKRAIDGCSDSLKHRELSARSVARRAAIARDLRQKRGITACTSIHALVQIYTNASSSSAQEVPP